MATNYKKMQEEFNEQFYKPVQALIDSNAVQTLTKLVAKLGNGSAGYQQLNEHLQKVKDLQDKMAASLEILQKSNGQLNAKSIKEYITAMDRANKSYQECKQIFSKQNMLQLLKSFGIDKAQLKDIMLDTVKNSKVVKAAVNMVQEGVSLGHQAVALGTGIQQLARGNVDILAVVDNIDAIEKLYEKICNFCKKIAQAYKAAQVHIKSWSKDGLVNMFSEQFQDAFKKGPDNLIPSKSDDAVERPRADKGSKPSPE